MKYRPSCAKMECDHRSDTILVLPSFGPIYFCAAHALMNLKEVL